MTDGDGRYERLWIALTFSGAATGAIIAGGLILLYLVDARPDASVWLTMFPGGVLLGGVFGLAIGTPVMFLIGLPIHALLQRLRWVGALAYILMGLAAATALTLVVVVLQSPEVTPGLRLGYAFPFALGTPIGATIFWLIRRPDRDEPSAHMPQPPAA